MDQILSGSEHIEVDMHTGGFESQFLAHRVHISRSAQPWSAPRVLQHTAAAK